ncbi:UNVERIFIED_CONTAM: hypothetical protein GTU68_054374 [Idotea baltica]|nr:hypothetical protein [Idotea baltica]
MSVRILGVYGGTNINTQGQEVAQGVDILVATPGRLYDLALNRGQDLGIIHSNKSQNFRIRAIEDFDDGSHRVLLATDVIGRGLDFDQISHVINFDVPNYPENYMHRIGRTGRAEQQGTSILFYSPKELEEKEAIEALMDYEIPREDFPEQVEVSTTLIPEERPKEKEINSAHKVSKAYTPGPAFHEKKEKNQKENQGGSYRKEIAKKYKKPRRKGGPKRK